MFFIPSSDSARAGSVTAASVFSVESSSKPNSLKSTSCVPAGESKLTAFSPAEFAEESSSKERSMLKISSSLSSEVSAVTGSSGKMFSFSSDSTVKSSSKETVSSVLSRVSVC